MPCRLSYTLTVAGGQPMVEIRFPFTFRICKNSPGCGSRAYLSARTTDCSPLTCPYFALNSRTISNIKLHSFVFGHIALLQILAVVYEELRRKTTSQASTSDQLLHVADTLIRPIEVNTARNKAISPQLSSV